MLTAAFGVAVSESQIGSDGGCSGRPGAFVPVAGRGTSVEKELRRLGFARGGQLDGWIDGWALGYLASSTSTSGGAGAVQCLLAGWQGRRRERDHP